MMSTRFSHWQSTAGRRRGSRCTPASSTDPKSDRRWRHHRTTTTPTNIITSFRPLSRAKRGVHRKRERERSTQRRPLHNPFIESCNNMSVFYEADFYDEITFPSLDDIVHSFVRQMSCFIYIFFWRRDRQSKHHFHFDSISQNHQ